ncbi:hypothetical protein [Halomonas sp. WWR20]
MALGKPRVVMVMLVCAGVGMALATLVVPPLDKVLFGLAGIGRAAIARLDGSHWRGQC